MTIDSTIREKPPCYGCTEDEEKPACHDHCPKDARNEYGFLAWTAEKERVKKNRNEYLAKPKVKFT